MILEDGGDRTAASLKQALDQIQDTYIPVSNVDGKRIQGKKQTTDLRKEFQCIKDTVQPKDLDVGWRQVQQQVQFITGHNNRKFHIRGSDRRQRQHQQQKPSDLRHNALQNPDNQRYLPVNANIRPLDASHQVSPNMWSARDPLYNNTPFNEFHVGSGINNVVGTDGGGDDAESLLIDFGGDDAGLILDSLKSQPEACAGTNDAEQSSGSGAAGKQEAVETMLIDF